MVQIPGRQLTLIVDLAAESSGRGWKGSITIPGLGIKGAPLSDVALKGSDIVFSIKSALADQRTGPAKFFLHLLGALHHRTHHLADLEKKSSKVKG